MSLAGLLDKTATIQRSTLTADGKGGASPTWADLLSDVAIRIQPVSARERVVLAAQQLNVTHKAYCEDAIDATDAGLTSLRDALNQAGKETLRLVFDGRNFMVRGVLDFDEQNRLCRLELEEASESWRGA